jgi:hypothetical protein
VSGDAVRVAGVTISSFDRRIAEVTPWAGFWRRGQRLPRVDLSRT